MSMRVADASPNQAPHRLPSIADVDVPGVISRRAARMPPAMPTALPTIVDVMVASMVCSSWITMSPSTRRSPPPRSSALAQPMPWSAPHVPPQVIART